MLANGTANPNGSSPTVARPWNLDSRTAVSHSPKKTTFAERAAQERPHLEEGRGCRRERKRRDRDDQHRQCEGERLERGVLVAQELQDGFGQQRQACQHGQDPEAGEGLAGDVAGPRDPRRGEDFADPGAPVALDPALHDVEADPAQEDRRRDGDERADPDRAVEAAGHVAAGRVDGERQVAGVGRGHVEVAREQDQCSEQQQA
jgi:hypothetical protein